MMKYICGLLAFLAIISIALSSENSNGQGMPKCAGGITDIPFSDANWTSNMVIDETKKEEDAKGRQTRYCTNSIRKQINMEISASVFYLSLGAYFSQDTVNRPGLANFFLGAAKEERHHAIMLIDYLTMRGEEKLKINNNFQFDVVTEVTSAKEALNQALEKELSVTKSIKSVIKQCENAPNDYHVVDYLTGVYLEEQYKGQRELAGKIATLTKMMHSNKDLGEFMFDKTLL